MKWTINERFTVDISHDRFVMRFSRIKDSRASTLAGRHIYVYKTTTASKCYITLALMPTIGLYSHTYKHMHTQMHALRKTRTIQGTAECCLTIVVVNAFEWEYYGLFGLLLCLLNFCTHHRYPQTQTQIYKSTNGHKVHIFFFFCISLYFSSQLKRKLIKIMSFSFFFSQLRTQLVDECIWISLELRLFHIYKKYLQWLSVCMHTCMRYVLPCDWYGIKYNFN